MSNPLSWLVRLDDGYAPVRIGVDTYMVSHPGVFVLSPSGENRFLPFGLLDQEASETPQAALVTTIGLIFALPPEAMKPQITYGKLEDGTPYAVIPKGADVPPELRDVVGAATSAAEPADQFPGQAHPKRYHNEAGEVAVMTTPDGGGWSTWAHHLGRPDEGMTTEELREFFLFEPELVAAILAKDEAEVRRIFRGKFGKDGGFVAQHWDRVRVSFLSPGTEFRLEYYDGEEYIVPKSEQVWIKA